MTRYTATSEGNIPYSAKEEAAADAIEASWLAKLAQEELNKYRVQRAAEYPPIGDQLDALFKAGLFPSEMAAMLQAVKDKYPKG